MFQRTFNLKLSSDTNSFFKFQKQHFCTVALFICSVTFYQFQILNIINIELQEKNPEHFDLAISRSRRPQVLLVKAILKMCSKLTGEHPCRSVTSIKLLSCRSVISIKLLCNVIEITLQYGCSPVNVLHIFRPTFTQNTSEWPLLNI